MLFQTEKRFDILDISTCNEAGLVEIAFLFFGFLGQNVAVKCMFSFDFS